MEVFGRTADGGEIRRIELRGGGLTARVLTWGSVIQDLRLDGHAAPLVLGFETFDPYPVHSPYFGATPGRNANRIAGGRFDLDGKSYQLDLNEKGRTHLHGGFANIATRNWEIVDLAADRVVLRIVDQDGRGGYPGNCEITATYHLHGDGILSVVYESTTDAPTPVNVCQHSYFNLDGRDDILGHDLMIAADHYLETDADQIPAGAPRPVVGTAFDFRQMGSIRRAENGEQVPFDHNFCLSQDRVAKRPVAMARSQHSGVSMEVRSGEPGVQFYSGCKMDVKVPGLEGRRYGPFAGFCLETQVWPDAVNRPDFPNGILRPGKTLRQETDYVFAKS